MEEGKRRMNIFSNGKALITLAIFLASVIFSAGVMVARIGNYYPDVNGRVMEQRVAILEKRLDTIDQKLDRIEQHLIEYRNEDRRDNQRK